MALAGSGTDVDPWRITTIGELITVLRDPGGSGHYRIVNDLDSGSYSGISNITLSVGGTYSAKVIDGNGYTVRLGTSQGTSVASCMFAGVHFKNIRIHCQVSISGGYTNYLFYRCSLTDVAVYAKAITTYSPNTTLVVSDNSTPYLIPRDMSRVVLLLDGDPTGPQQRWLSTSLAGFGVTPSRMYVYTNGATGGGLIKSTVALTVAYLDALTDNAFSDNGWWQGGVDLTPLQTEQVALTLQTIAAGAGVSRRLWLENELYTRYIGDTDVAGVGQYNVRIRKWSCFTVYASEDFGADELRADKAIVAGAWYLPPADNGYVYQAGTAGRVTTVAGVVFNDQPVTISGIVFTPRPVYKAVLSERASVLRDGAAQTIVLDNSGGGGPVIEGDPAYLDGLVEQVHPMLGTVQALANSEVFAFERRGAEFVAMGSAFSNSQGEFRVETDIYGGGDVFAFAADFPGVTWQAGMALSLGDKVRPTQNNGYVYEIITAGVAGASEPAWWADQGDGTEGYIGSARAKAKPYYQPVGHGPLKMTLVTP